MKPPMSTSIGLKKTLWKEEILMNSGGVLQAAID